MSKDQSKGKAKGYHIIIDQKPHWVETPKITGAGIKELAGVSQEFGVWMEQPGPEDRPIADNEEVDLTAHGTERFFTGKKETTEGLGHSFLPSEDKEYLQRKSIEFAEVESDGHRGLIFSRYGLPAGRYDNNEADILLILPTGYNDVGPDMFFLYPWVKLLPDGQYPKAANVAFAFNSQQWQRWSRHADAKTWRPGIDGIRTALIRIKTALEGARV